jgi:predicted  nucleic acid-binding Zn-ribbon protein
MNDIRIPISPGELLDKITILQIKAERIDDAAKVANVKTELEMLSKVWNETVEADDEISALSAELKSINEALWEIEDDIRDEERNKRFHRAGARGLRHQRRARQRQEKGQPAPELDHRRGKILPGLQVTSP